MNRRELAIVGSTLLLVAASLSLGVFYPVLSAAQRKPPNGHVPRGLINAVEFGVYWDPVCSNAVSSIDWGVLDAGSTVDRTVYIRNEGKVAAAMNLTTSNWTPSTASDWISFNWDYAGQTLNVDQAIQVKFTLAVSSNATEIGSFNFDAIITPVQPSR